MRSFVGAGAVVTVVLAACAAAGPGDSKRPERHLYGDIPLRVANLTGTNVCELIVVERREDGTFSPNRAYFVDPVNNSFRDGFHRDYVVKAGRYRVKAQTCARRAGETQYERAFDLDVHGPTKLILLPSDKADGSGAALPSKPLVYKKDRYGAWGWVPAEGDPVPPDPTFVAVVDRSLNESRTATQSSHYVPPLAPSNPRNAQPSGGMTSAAAPQPSEQEKCVPMGGECTRGKCCEDDSTHGCYREESNGSWTGRLVCMRAPGK